VHKVRKLLRNKKALTALQTAILTGVGIAVALIVGYWVWTVVVGSIRTERLSLTIPSASFEDSKWNITFKIKNIGPSDATIVDIRINGKSYDSWADGSNNYARLDSSNFNPDSPQAIKAGEELICVIILNYGDYKHGQTIEIAIVTASNQVYTASVSLP